MFKNGSELSKKKYNFMNFYKWQRIRLKILMNKEGVKRYNSILIEKFINVFVDPEKLHKEMALPSNSRVVNQRKVS